MTGPPGEEEGAGIGCCSLRAGELLSDVSTFSLELHFLSRQQVKREDEPWVKLQVLRLSGFQSKMPSMTNRTKRAESREPRRIRVRRVVSEKKTQQTASEHTKE